MASKLNSGALFRNDKQGNDKAPDYRGNANVDGKDKEISAWVNVGQESGQQYLSITFKEPFVKTGAPSQSSSQPAKSEDDLPF